MLIKVDRIFLLDLIELSKLVTLYIFLFHHRSGPAQRGIFKVNVGTRFPLNLGTETKFWLRITRFVSRVRP